jgi:small subunit ribosomal protein S13
MARISGISIPDEKQVWVSLTYVHGIGPNTAKLILSRANIDPTI